MKKRQLVLLMATLSLYAPFVQAQTLPSYVPANGLRVWYSFTGDANDASGNGLHGTTFGVVSVEDRLGHQGSAYQFTGNNTSYIIRENPSNQMLDAGTGSFTLSLWFKTNATGIRTLVNKRKLNGTTNEEGYSVFLDQGKVVFGLEDANGINTIANGTNSFNDNTWHHVVAIRDVATDKSYLYIDNQLEVLVTDGSVVTLSTTGDFYVGRWLYYDQYCFQGTIDDIGFWNRALGLNEISDLFHICSDSIQAQPADQYALVGSMAQFNVVYSDTSADFQWQSDLGFGFQDLSNAGQFTGVHSGTLTVSNVSMANHNQLFRCIVYNANCHDTSSHARLFVSMTGINHLYAEPSIKFYPNPTTGKFCVESQSPNLSIEQVGVCTISGHVLRSERTKPCMQIQLDMSGKPGVYYLKITLSDGSIKFNKILVQ